MPIPSNLSERQFAAALAELRRAVGDEWVFSSAEDIALWRWLSEIRQLLANPLASIGHSGP